MVLVGPTWDFCSRHIPPYACQRYGFHAVALAMLTDEECTSVGVYAGQGRAVTFGRQSHQERPGHDRVRR